LGRRDNAASVGIGEHHDKSGHDLLRRTSHTKKLALLAAQYALPTTLVLVRCYSNRGQTRVPTALLLIKTFI
jgi:hypothetical protein